MEETPKNEPNQAITPIVARLREVLRESAVGEHDWDGVGAETSFESLGLDSLSLLDLLYDVEQEFGIAIEAAEVISLRTVGAVAELLQQRGA